MSANALDNGIRRKRKDGKDKRVNENSCIDTVVGKTERDGQVVRDGIC